MLHQQVRRVLKPKRYRRAGASPLPLLTKPDGVVCQSLEETVATWRSHFAKLEGGEVVSSKELVLQCRARQQSFVGSDLLDIKEVPSFRCFEKAIRSSAPGKAAGPDLLPPTLLRCFSHQVADLL